MRIPWRGWSVHSDSKRREIVEWHYDKTHIQRRHRPNILAGWRVGDFFWSFLQNGQTRRANDKMASIDRTKFDIASPCRLHNVFEAKITKCRHFCHGRYSGQQFVSFRTEVVNIRSKGILRSSWIGPEVWSHLLNGNWYWNFDCLNGLLLNVASAEWRQRSQKMNILFSESDRQNKHRRSGCFVDRLLRQKVSSGYGIAAGWSSHSWRA